MNSLKQKISSLSKPIGFSLIALSLLSWLAVFVIPFMDYEMLEIAGIITALIIFGEVAFYIAILFLGKTYWQAIKQKLLDLLEAAKSDKN